MLGQYTAQPIPYGPVNPTTSLVSSTAGNSNGWQSSIATWPSDYADATCKLKFDASGRWVTLRINTSGGSLSWNLMSQSASGSYSFQILESSDNTTFTAISTITSGVSGSAGGTAYSASLNASTRYIRFQYTTKATGNFGLGNVKILSPPCSHPTLQASTLTSSEITSSSMTLNWLRGNGDGGVIILAKSGSAVNSDPSSGSSYTANSVFGSGSQIGTGNYVVYQGTGTSVNLTGLNPNTTYHFAIYEYNTSGTCYNLNELTGNATTLCGVPTTQGSSIIENYSCANAITLNWTNGNGSKRIVIMNTSNSFANPTNGSDPIANTFYSGSGEQVIYNNNGNNVVVSGLNSSTTYWFRIYEYNCNGSNTVYLTSTGTNNPQSITTPTITCPTSNDYRTITSGNWGINTSWERGTGTGWTNCVSGDFPNVSSANVIIRNGHTIDNDGSGSPPWDVNNLTVETGGKLWDAAFTGNNDYI